MNAAAQLPLPFSAAVFALGMALLPTCATADALDAGTAPSPLLAVDQNRTTVVERVVAQWGDALVAAGTGLRPEQLQTLLMGLRADQLLAASLAGSLDGLRNAIAVAVPAASPAAAGTVRTKALGDMAADLVYTPVSPCRLIDTRASYAAVYQNAGPFNPGDVRTYTVQGGNGVCLSQLPAGLNPAALQLQVFGIPANAVSGDIEIQAQGSTFGNSSTLVFLGNNAFTSASTTARINVGSNQFSVQVRGGIANVAMDVVGYFRAPNGGNINITGNLTLVESTATAGNIMKGLTPFIHNYGGSNTFIGESAGNFKMTGAFNTAGGYSALAANTTGFANTASGETALESNTTGNYNTASGGHALNSNSTGNMNTASGAVALGNNTTGNNNTAIGMDALALNTTGNNNIAIGYQAALHLTTEPNNIMIGNVGIAGDTGSIRIGDATHTRTFIAGVRGRTTGAGDAVPVIVDGNGQLGTLNSSRRFKDDIADMDAASAALMRLRPVTFHYKTDATRSPMTLQYGLIAEEVAEVYPGLVAHSADGQIETVMYQYLPPMLLNEFQKQQRVIAAQAARIDALEKQAAEIAQLKELVARLATAIRE